MSAPLIAFTLFNLAAAAACLGAGVRLLQPEERAVWRSKRLLFIAALLAWSFPLAALAGVAWAWAQFEAGMAGAVVFAIAPIAWLALMGFIFAAVDYLEDGVLDFGRGRT
ncbi:MAG: hypothetical protein GC189_14405 [Alphaproteobacteria bacterium]|nr:hypothetical protein [Alphaproteobacteria bacterium]